MKKEVGKVRPNLVELYSRRIEIDKQNDNIYLSGDDNLYPYGIERVINNSPTATRSCDMLQKFYSGKGVVNDRLVNLKKGYLLSDIVDLIADDLAPQNGAYIWVGYGINEEGEPFQKTLDILDYSNTRISKEDDNDYAGRIYVKDYKGNSIFAPRSSNGSTWYYPYNDSKDIVIAQMKADVRAGLKLKKKEDITIEQMIKHYRGQVYYLNLTPKYKYALSKFDSVFNDADTEYRFSQYSNKEFRTGFLGKLIAITQGLDEDEDEQISADLGMLLGSENSGSMLHLRANAGADLKEVLRIEQIKAQFDDKLFVENDKRIRRNILGAANNLPEPLIYAGEGALFGTSGDTYREMKLFYQEQTQKERRAIEKALTRLGFETKIIPLVDEEVINEQNGTINEE